LSPQPIYVLNALLYLPGLLGLALAPFLPGLALMTPKIKSGRLTELLATIIILGLALAVFAGNNLFPGNVFNPYVFNYAPVPGLPQLFASPLFSAIEVTSLLALAFFIRRWSLWWPADKNAPQVALLALAAGQLLPLLFLHYTPYDRYYLPVIFLVTPLAALALGKAAASSSRSAVLRSVLLGLAVVLAGLAVYAVGEQDYQAVQSARNHAACLAYLYAPPSDVNAGYEANAVYLELPYYEHAGTVLGGVPQPGTSKPGPLDPTITLVGALPDDPRPGYPYSSLAPGKVVLVLGPRGAGLDIHVPSVAPGCPGSSG